MPVNGAESITATAVDGQGKESPKYLALLEAMLERGVAERATFFTSDPHCSHPHVQCVRVPTLDYFAYSEFCVEEMHKHVETDFCLTVQLDGFAVNPDLWDSKFLDYDYIGAPWRSTWSRKLPEAYRVGNGGFSLRSQKFLREGAKFKWTADWSKYRLPHRRGDIFRYLLPFRYRLGRATWGNEDVYLAWVRREELEARGVRFAPVEVARRFAVQHCTSLDEDHTVAKTFGFHGEDLFPAVKQELRRQDVRFPYETKPA